MWPGLIALMLLAVATWPMDFSLRRVFRVGGRLEGFPLPPSSILDPVRNVLLFVPLGVVWPRSGRGALVQAFGAAALLSLVIEAFQVALPGRIVSVQDVLANSMGAGLGLLGREGGRRMAASWISFRFRTVTAFTLGFWVSTLLGISTADTRVRRLLWPVGDHITLGNRPLGEREWCGRVDGLRISSPIGSAPWVLSWEPLEGQGCETADPRTAPIPAELSSLVTRGEGVAMTLTVTPDHGYRRGLGRILEISPPGSTEARSLMLGQWGRDLQVRVRRPLGGVEGRRPHYMLRGVFETSEPVDIQLSLEPDSVVIRAGLQTVVHRPRLSREWWILFDRVVGWRPDPLLGRIAEALFWLLLTAPAGLAWGLSPAATSRPLHGLLGWGLLWSVTMIPGVLPSSVAASPSTAPLVLMGLAAWLMVGRKLASISVSASPPGVFGSKRQG